MVFTDEYSPVASIKVNMKGTSPYPESPLSPPSFDGGFKYLLGAA
jgi:hypothetical protein